MNENFFGPQSERLLKTFRPQIDLNKGNFVLERPLNLEYPIWLGIEESNSVLDSSFPNHKKISLNIEHRNIANQITLSMINMRIIGKRFGVVILLTQRVGSVLMHLCGHGLQGVLKQLKSHPLLWRRHKLAW